jgi:cobalt-zinc-cadmium efflux system membrane fusion protein
MTMSFLLQLYPGNFVVETALVVLVTTSLIAGAALATAGCLKRNPAAADCILFWGLVWILLTPPAAIASAWSGVTLGFISLPARAVISSFDAMPERPVRWPVDVPPPAAATVDVRNDRPQGTPSATPSMKRSAADAHALLSATVPASRPSAANSGPVDGRPAEPRRVREAIAALFAVWLFGALFAASRTTRSYAKMRAVRRALFPVANESLGDLRDEIQRRLYIVRLPEIGCSDRVCTPCVIGLFRPAIVLPVKGLEDVSPKQLCHVLVHECAHVVRRDTWVVLLERVAAAFFWPNPLIHFFNRRLSRVREEACDNYVLSGTDSVTYGETLLHVAQFVRAQRPMAASVGIFHGRAPLEQRIAGLIDERRNTAIRAGRVSRILAMAAFAGLSLLACGDRGFSDQAPPPAGGSQADVAPLQASPQIEPARPAPALALQAGLPADTKADTQSVQLAPVRPHTLFVPEKVRIQLGIRRDNADQLTVAKRPTPMRPLVIPGTTALDRTAIVPMRSLWPPQGAVVVEIGKVADFSGPGKGTGIYREREIRSGNRVTKGQLLAVFDSVDVGNKENDLIDALAHLKLDEEFLKQAEAKPAGTRPILWEAERRVQGDKNGIHRAQSMLHGWGVSDKQIQAALDEAEKIKKRGGRRDPSKDTQWGRVEMRSPIDGVVIECNLALHEVIPDDGINLFQIIENFDKLLVVANLPEDKLSALEALGPRPQWTVETGRGPAASGFITDIQFLVDPNQHTLTVKGYVDNRQARLRGGQFVKATIGQPIPPDVVEVPIDCVLETGPQALVFAQKDPARADYTMQRVDVVDRLGKTLFLRSKPFAQGEERSPQETEKGLLPKQAVLPGTRLIRSSLAELKAVLEDREAAAHHQLK